jgi:hypothetical protein
MRTTVTSATLDPGVSRDELRLEDAINETCPWSGKPIQADSLARYKGWVVGFCNPGCRDKFARAVDHFEAAGSAGRRGEPKADGRP